MKTKDYPSWACEECGKKHGRGRKSVSTWHYGKCDVCGKNKNVTEPKDFGHFQNWFNIGDEGFGAKVRYWKPPTGVKIRNPRDFGHFKKRYK